MSNMACIVCNGYILFSGEGRGSAGFNVGQCFQISLRLHACLRVGDECMCACKEGRGRGIVIAVYMFVRVCAFG